MSKILDFLKKQPQKYGWKFWFSLIMGLVTALGVFECRDEFTLLQCILLFIPVWILGYCGIMVSLWMLKVLLKGTGKTAKVAGKVAVGAGKMAVKGAAAMANVGPSSGNGNMNKSSEKKVNKVWTMQYVGKGRQDGPEYLQVPSSNQTGRPTGNEIKEALLSLGYDSATAHSLANGGGESTWKVVS